MAWGNERNVNEIKGVIPRVNLVIGQDYVCSVEGQPANMVMQWDGVRFRGDLVELHHIEEGRRIGRVTPMSIHTTKKAKA